MLSREKIERINQLSKKSKTEGLSPQEKEEQQSLRKEYIQSFRSSFKSQILNMKVVDPHGQDVTPSKLKREQNKRKKH